MTSRISQVYCKSFPGEASGVSCLVLLNLPVLPASVSPPPQTLFMVFTAIVSILLINLLIAMMGNTYERIAEMKNEWMRQVGG